MNEVKSNANKMAGMIVSCKKRIDNVLSDITMLLWMWEELVDAGWMNNRVSITSPSDGKPVDTLRTNARFISESMNSLLGTLRILVLRINDALPLKDNVRLIAVAEEYALVFDDVYYQRIIRCQGEELMALIANAAEKRKAFCQILEEVTRPFCDKEKKEVDE